MEQTFTKSQVLSIIENAVLQGKLSLAQYVTEFIEEELKEKNEWFEHLSESGEFMNERWIECNGSLHALYKIKEELEEVIKLLEEQKK